MPESLELGVPDPDLVLGPDPAELLALVEQQLHQLAAEFEGAVGEIIDAVSSSSQELEAAATSLNLGDEGDVSVTVTNNASIVTRGDRYDHQ